MTAPNRAGSRVATRLAAGLTASILVVVVAGCGNRLSRDEILAQNVTTGDASSSGVDAGEDRAAGADAGAGDTGGDDVTGPGEAAAGADPGAGSAPAAGSVGATAGLAGGAGGGAGGGTAPAAQGGGAKKPIVIGMVGWLSGIGGQTSAATRDVVVAWSKSVNAKGGIKGHPVQLLVADDGGNESRSLSIARDFVENKGAVALLAYSGGSAVAVSNYAKSKNIPVVGGSVIEQLWTQNPMMFPQNSATDGHFWGAAKLAADRGVKKVATVYCAEVPACQQSNETFVKHAKSLGLQVVYEGRISFTQPDYTAECLQMRSAGVESVVPITENSSTVRLAQSCSRQDFKPIYNIQAANTSMEKVPEFDGAIGNLAYFPWFLYGGAPALDEYGEALKKFAPNRITNGVDAMAGGWMAGKIFERAAQNVSDNPTSAEILEGLWAMKGFDVGGLQPGGMARTFNRNQPTGETFCVYETKITGGKWTAPRGLNPVCR